MRAIYATSRSPFAGLSLWLNHVLKPTLKKFSHIVTSGEQFLERLCVPMQDEVMLLHFYLDDFFFKVIIGSLRDMSG